MKKHEKMPDESKEEPGASVDNYDEEKQAWPAVVYYSGEYILQLLPLGLEHCHGLYFSFAFFSHKSWDWSSSLVFFFLGQNSNITSNIILNLQWGWVKNILHNNVVIVQDLILFIRK